MLRFKFLPLAFALTGACGVYAGWTNITGAGNIVAFTDTPTPVGWALDSTYTPKPTGGYALRRFMGGTSAIVPAGLVDLDIVSASEIWGVNDQGSVFRNVTADQSGGGSWIGMGTPASARRIANGSNSGAYILTTEAIAGGYKIYKYDGAGTSWDDWHAIAGGLMELDVDNNGDLWGVNNEGKVFHLPNGGAWQLKSSGAVNIGAGTGNVYILASDSVSGGHPVKKWDGSNFISITGALRDLQVDAGGRLWGANASNTIFYYVP